MGGGFSKRLAGTVVVGCADEVRASKLDAGSVPVLSATAVFSLGFLHAPRSRTGFRFSQLGQDLVSFLTRETKTLAMTVSVAADRDLFGAVVCCLTCPCT